MWLLDLEGGERKKIRVGWTLRDACFTFSPAGDLAALGLGNGEVSTFPLGEKKGAGTGEGGKVRWFAHRGGVTTMSFSPDGRLLLTGSKDGEAAVWTTRGERVFHLAGHEEMVFDGGFMGPDRCYTCSSDGTTRIWSLKPEWAPLFPVGSPSESPLAFHGSSDTYYMVAENGKILENRIDGSTIRTIPTPGRCPILVFGNPRGKELLLSSKDNQPRIWLGPGAGWRRLGKLKGRFIRAAFSPARKEFVSYFYLYRKGKKPIRNLAGFSFEGGKVRSLFFFPSNPCRPFLYSPGGNFFLAGLFRGRGLALYGRKGKLLFQALDGASIRGFRFLRDGRFWAFTFAKGVFLLDRRGKVLRHFPGFSSHLTAFDVREDTGEIVYASRMGDLVLRGKEGRIVFSWRDPEKSVEMVAFMREPGRILCVTPKSVKILDSRQGKAVLYVRPGKDVWRSGLSPSRKWLWLLYKKTSARRWVQFLPLEEKTVLSLAGKAAGKGFTAGERKAYGALLEGAVSPGPVGGQ